MKKSRKENIVPLDYSKITRKMQGGTKMAFTREEQRKIAHELLDMVLEINGYKEHPDGDGKPQAMLTIYGSTNGLETFVFQHGYNNEAEHQKIDFLPTLHFNTDGWKQVDDVRELLSRYLPEGKQNEEV